MNDILGGVVKMSRFPGGSGIYASLLLKRHSVVIMSQNTLFIWLIDAVSVLLYNDYSNLGVFLL